MSGSRVLIIDDSVVVRKMLSELFESDPDIDAVDTASNATIGIRKINDLKPDIVTLDVEMPDMNGLDAIVAIRSKHPNLPVIMFSAVTTQACTITLDALQRGATDYATKPTGLSRKDAEQFVRDGLLKKVKILSKKSTFGGSVPEVKKRSVKSRAEIELVVIGSSTGGPNALSDVFRGLKTPLAVPICIVQHMPPVFTQLLAKRLSGVGPTPVVEAKDREQLKPGYAYIAPGDFHLTVARNEDGFIALLNQAEPENCCRPAVDVLFRSAAETVGAGAFGVVLTGLGTDGLKGTERLAENGSTVLVQDEASSVVWGMPGAIAQAGLASEVLSLPALTNQLANCVQISSRKPKNAA